MGRTEVPYPPPHPTPPKGNLTLCFYPVKCCFGHLKVVWCPNTGQVDERYNFVPPFWRNKTDIVQLQNYLIQFLCCPYPLYKNTHKLEGKSSQNLMHIKHRHLSSAIIPPTKQTKFLSHGISTIPPNLIRTSFACPLKFISQPNICYQCVKCSNNVPPITIVCIIA